MCIWWKNVEVVPEGGISIKADSEAWSKWNPFWRFQHKWAIFRVETNGRPYHVFFDDGVNKMMWKKLVKTEYFAARIGPRDIRFVATSDMINNDSHPVELAFFNDSCILKRNRREVRFLNSWFPETITII